MLDNLYVSLTTTLLSMEVSGGVSSFSSKFQIMLFFYLKHLGTASA